MIFVDLQKAIDLVNHNFLLARLKHYGIKVVTYSWFGSYLTDRKQYASISGFNSKHLPVPPGVPQGSVLGPLLFLTYINGLNTIIEDRKVHHFADDTNLLHIIDTIKKLSEAVNSDLKNFTNWHNANKISLSASKTELILFKPKIEKLNFDLKLKVNGKRLYATKSVKYLSVKINENLFWIDHINDTTINLTGLMLRYLKYRNL